MLHKFLPSLILTACICCCVSGAQAEESTPAQDNVYHLGEVVVSGDKGSETSTTMSIITEADIRNSGASTLDDALRLVPGLNIRTAGDGTPRIDIRGMRTRNVTLLLNGVPVNSSYDNQFDPSLYPVENIAKIKVIRGAGSVLYGPGGNAGVINIITKQGTEGVHGSVGFQAKENDSYTGRATLSEGNDRFKMFVSGSLMSAKDYPLSSAFTDTKNQQGDTRDNSDKQRGNVATTFMFQPEEATQIGLNMEYHSAEYGKPAEVDASNPKYVRMDDLDGFSTQLTAQHQFESPLNLKGWVYANQQDETENRYDDDDYDSQTGKKTYTDESTTTRFGGTVQAGYGLDALGDLTLALSAEKAQWDDTYQAKPDKNGDITETDKMTTQSSVALEYNVSPIDPLSITLGSGYAVLDRPDANNVDAVTYYIGAAYDLTETTRIKVNHARKVRFASLKEMYTVDNGDPDLDPECTYHYEAGVEQQIPGIATMAEVTVYQIDAKDFIEKNDDTDLYENNDKYRFRGVEAGVTNTSIRNLKLHVAYTYLDAENRSDDRDNDYLQYRPRDKFTAEATYAHPCGFTAYASYRYLANQYDLDGADRTRLDDMNVVDIKLTQALLGKTLDVYVGADNLFDAEYEESYDLPRPGRSMYCGFDYRF